jgi:hypothetical protein
MSSPRLSFGVALPQAPAGEAFLTTATWVMALTFVVALTSALAVTRLLALMSWPPGLSVPDPIEVIGPARDEGRAAFPRSWLEALQKSVD